jgi:deoxyribose-phosphate aldolase
MKNTKYRSTDSAFIDQVMVEERVAKFQSRSIKNESKKEVLHQILNMIDLTTLEGKDTPQKIIQMCRKAVNPHNNIPNLPPVAAVCVYPSMVKIAKEQLQNTSVKVASVSTAFPSGQAPISVKMDDTKFAVDQGADEIDMVISRGKFLSGEFNFVFDEIAQIKELCGKSRLKVILETGEIGTLDQVRKASMLAMHAGADFIKTSTGKIQPAATMPVTYVMLQAINDFFEETGKQIGMKPAGGISTSKAAIHYIVMLNEVLGPKWMTNKYFRFGASSLANDVLLQLEKMETGFYSSPNYISID